MFHKILGAKPPANDEPELEQTEARDLDAAIEHCVKPEGQGFFRAVFLSDRACDLMDGGDLEGAIGEFQRALEQCPEGWYAGNLHVLLGNAYQSSNKLDLALAAYTSALELDCSAPHEAYRRRSFIQSALGRFDAALGDMRLAATEGEDAAFVAAKFCAIHLVMGDPEAAYAAAAETPETQAGETQYRLEQMQSRAEARLLLGDRVGAIADLATEGALIEGDNPDMALWRYTIRRRAGLDGTTPQIETLVRNVGEDDTVYHLYRWFADGDAAARDHLPGMAEDRRPNGSRLTSLCESHYLLGAVSELDGDKAAAFRHYTFATAYPENAWCIEYALAQYGLRRVE